MNQYLPTSNWVDRVSKWPFPLGTLFFLISSKIARDVFKKLMIEKSTDTALHPIYAYSVDNDKYSIWDHRWQSSKAAQSLRFRFEWVKNTLVEIVSERVNKNLKTQLISLGSGTGLAYFNLLKTINNNIEITMLDADERALNRAKNMFSTLISLPVVNYINSISTDFLKNTSISYDLIESIGIAEYVSDEWLKNEFKFINQRLTDDGHFIGAAISSSDEYNFAHKVLHWPNMQYRSKEAIKNLLENSGFKTIILEECGIFVAWIASR